MSKASTFLQRLGREAPFRVFGKMLVKRFATDIRTIEV